MPKTVLIVDDEQPIRELLADYLADEGYLILQAASSSQAFEILATRPQLDLLLTDYRLPDGITGVMIAEPALKLRPDLKVIFISAHPIEVQQTGSSIALSAPVLCKPFALATLRSEIKALLS